MAARFAFNGNIEHPTSNAQHPISGGALIGCSMLVVGCWMLDVERLPKILFFLAFFVFFVSPCG
jgi:uncharacterized membrane protein YiaA